MRTLAFLLLLLIATLFGCGNTNPGNHTPEEIANAKPKPMVKVAQAVPAMGGSLDGPQLYAQNCGTCHRDGANGAPPMAGMLSRRELPSGTPANDGRVCDLIKMGRANMPGFANTLTDEQISAIISYMHTL